MRISRTGSRRGIVGGLTTALLLGGLVVAAPASAAPATPATAAPDVVASTQRISGQSAQEKQYADEILVLLNADRVKKGMAPLQRMHQLDVVAHNWSEQQAAAGKMSHNPRYSQQYPDGWRAAGENVAYGYRSPETMYRGWYSSPGHYANMFNSSYTHIGIGVAYASNGTPYGTQNFARYSASFEVEPAPAPAPAPAPRPSTNIPLDNGSSTARIDDGGFGGNGNTYYLNDSFSATANIEMSYANAGGRVYVGDWDGDGKDSLAYRIGNTFYVRNSNTTGNAQTIFTYGRAGDRVYVGDWDGNGTDTFAVRRGSDYHVKNSLGSGNADEVISYGRAGDDILVGDWNGNGKDSLAVRRGNTYFIKNAIVSGNADHEIDYGRAGDDVYVGNWDGRGGDSLAVRRGKDYYVSNVIRGGNADFSISYGRTTDTTLVGDWNGDGEDTFGVRR